MDIVDKHLVISSDNQIRCSDNISLEHLSSPLSVEVLIFTLLADCRIP